MKFLPLLALAVLSAVSCSMPIHKVQVKTESCCSEMVMPGMDREAGTCSPTGICTACKNCKYCKNCSSGGECSVCK